MCGHCHDYRGFAPDRDSVFYAGATGKSGFLAHCWSGSLAYLRFFFTQALSSRLPGILRRTGRWGLRTLSCSSELVITAVSALFYICTYLVGVGIAFGSALSGNHASDLSDSLWCSSTPIRCVMGPVPDETLELERVMMTASPTP